MVERIWSTEDEEDWKDDRPGLHFDLKQIPFGETKVKLKKEFVAKIEKDVECGKILKKQNVKLQSGKMTGPWNGIYAVGQWLMSYFPSFDLTHHGYDEEEVISSSRSSSIDQSELPPSAADQSAQSNLPDESFGEKQKVQEALKFLKDKKVDGSTGTTSSSSQPKGATGGSTSNVTTGSSSAAGSSSPREKSTTVEELSCVLFQNVNVSVYQGDICKETTDVIVNSANERLHHSAGAAKAIVQAGGKSIQDESDAIMKERRYYDLDPGQVVVTKAGKLPCNLTWQQNPTSPFKGTPVVPFDGSHDTNGDKGKKNV